MFQKSNKFARIFQEQWGHAYKKFNSPILYAEDDGVGILHVESGHFDDVVLGVLRHLCSHCADHAGQIDQHHAGQTWACNPTYPSLFANKSRFDKFHIYSITE